jgi:hypothetical protein
MTVTNSTENYLIGYRNCRLVGSEVLTVATVKDSVLAALHVESV